MLSVVPAAVTDRGGLSTRPTGSGFHSAFLGRPVAIAAVAPASWTVSA